jgi:hypothetical protein
MANRPDPSQKAKPSPSPQADQQAPTKNAPAAKAALAGPGAAIPQAAPANVESDRGKQAATVDERPRNRAADQSDDLLNLTEEELREIARPGTAIRGYTAYAQPGGGKEGLSSDERPRTANAGTGGKVAQAEGPVRRPAAASGKAADQTDDLLSPTDDELQGIAAPAKGADKSARPEGAAPKAPAANAKRDGAASADIASEAKGPAQASAHWDTAVAESKTEAAPVIGIKSAVDAESWAEYGGWYRQDYTIFYRPTGHKDKFIHSWLVVAGPLAPSGDKSPAAAIFDLLTSKDAQGSCTKCHSVDDNRGKGRFVNFAPPSVESKRGRFTNFVHEPHFGIMENRGCLTCHEIEKGRAYLQSFEQGNPKNFVSNFSEVKKDLCQTCHTSGMARQDCLLCHKYHVNGVITPIMNTKLPTE